MVSVAPDYQAFESRNLGRLRQALRQVAATELARYDPRLAARFDPSDLVQDAFLRACRAIGTWRGETDDELFAWLHSILSNHLANEVRACLTLRRDVRREVHALPTVEGRGDPGGVELSDPQARRPETRLEADEALAILARGLSALEDDQRRAFLLRHVEGLSSRDRRATPEISCFRRGADPPGASLAPRKRTRGGRGPQAGLRSFGVS